MLKLHKESAINIQTGPMMDSRFLTILEDANLTKRAYKRLISGIDQSKKEDLFNKLSKLHEYKLLNSDSLCQIGIYFNKKHRIQPTAVTKLGRKTSKLPRSRLLIDNNNALYVEHKDNKKYELGGDGFIKKGYDTSEDTKPIYSIKKTVAFKYQKLELEKTKQTEVHIQRLLGHFAEYFISENKTFNTSYSISTWKPGKNLNQYSSEEMEKYEIGARLRWLKSLLSDLVILHNNYYVHTDIDPRNVILDSENKTADKSMRLIDFDRSQHRAEVLPPEALQQGREHYYKFSDDIYSMGIIVAKLFPSLFEFDSKYSEMSPVRKDTLIKSTARDEKLTEASSMELLKDIRNQDNEQFLGEFASIFKIKKENLTLQEKAIYHLFDAMRHPQAEYRCTSKNAFAYISEILLTALYFEKQILDIARETIDSIELNANDILHDSERPLFIYKSLSRNGLLSKKLCLELDSIELSKYKQRDNLIDCLEKKELLTSENIKSLDLAIKNESSLEYFNIKVNTYYKLGLLDQKVFDKLLKTSFAAELKAVDESKNIEKIRRNEDRPNSEFIVDDKRFYIEHDKKRNYPSGAFGRIKKGYITETTADTIPKYAVKIMLDKEEAYPAIQNASKYYQLLGDNALFFKRTSKDKLKYYLIGPYRPGKALSKYSDEELKAYSYTDRLKMLKSGLIDLNQFHDKDQVHGDVSFNNFNLDEQKPALRLLDFDFSRPRSRYMSYGALSYGIPDETGNTDGFAGYSEEVYHMGMVAAKLFPELYKIERGKLYLLVMPGNRSHLTSIEKAIVRLIDAMLIKKGSEKINEISPEIDRFNCTVKKALHFTEKLLENVDQLSVDESIIEKIAAETIDNVELNEEDIFHDSFRPLLLKSTM